MKILESKGHALLWLLITVIIILVLVKMMLPQTTQMLGPNAPTRIKTESQAKKTVDSVRAQMKQLEKVSQQRVNAFDNF